MKDIIAIIRGKALVLMFSGPAYFILHRALRTWSR